MSQTHCIKLAFVWIVNNYSAQFATLLSIFLKFCLKTLWIFFSIFARPNTVLVFVRFRRFAIFIKKIFFPNFPKYFPDKNFVRKFFFWNFFEIQFYPMDLNHNRILYWSCNCAYYSPIDRVIWRNSLLDIGSLYHFLWFMHADQLNSFSVLYSIIT